MEENTKNKVTRREFLGLSALGLASLTILPSWMMNGVRIAPSDRVVMGFVGLGTQSFADFTAFSHVPGVQVAACCDVDSIKAERFKRHIETWQASKNMNRRCDKYEFYEDLLNRKDIDAVSITTPDHWHALVAIHACDAGKDVYCQKPLSYTITEGLAMVRAVRHTNRVFQVGSQQRSMKEFQKAIELVQSGAIGHIEKIHVAVGPPPNPLDLPEMPVPGNLNFSQWMGPLNDPKIHYHPDLCPPVSLKPEQNEKLWGAWRWYRETGNGHTADLGAHMFDIAQAALGMDGLGPVEYIPKGYRGTAYTTMKYANGVVMTEQPYLGDNEGGFGIRFIGSDGWIEVTRGYLACSDPSKVPAALAGKRPLSAEDEEKEMAKLEKNEAEFTKMMRAAYVVDHMQNFIDCIRSRENPIAPVEVGCSTNTLCCLVNIAHELQRPVKWNPATLSFGDDKEAANHRLYKYEYRNPYTLPYHL